MTLTLDNPAAVQERLEQIEEELAELQNDYEEAALIYFKDKRAKEKTRAEHFLKTQGSVAERNAKADFATAMFASGSEATYESFRAKSRVLEVRASIGMSLLRAQSRAGA